MIPEGIAETIRLAAECGLVGCSIEDTILPGTSNKSYSYDIAVNRIQAAVDAAREIEFPFVLTAWADGVMIGSYDVEEALRRLKAFEDAGAEVLYAPMLPNLEAVKYICDNTIKPVNVLATAEIAKHSVSELSEAGAKRISVGCGLAHIAQSTFINVAREMREENSFSGLLGGVSDALIDQLIQSGTATQRHDLI